MFRVNNKIQNFFTLLFQAIDDAHIVSPFESGKHKVLYLTKATTNFKFILCNRIVSAGSFNKSTQNL